jgi:hypothetical protein
LVTSKISVGKEGKVLMTAQPKHRILIIGDSHVGGYTERLSDNLGHSFNITSYVKLNNDLDIITNTEQSQSKNMTKNDVVILCGGAKNIGKNETHKGLHCISQFIRNKGHTNVIIMEASHRFDLVPTSCVNKEVVSFNRKLQKTIISFNHAENVNMSTKRQHFTRHGLHMNGSRKDWIASLLPTKIMQIFTTHKPKSPIFLT